MDDQHTKTWCCILETSNEWMTKKCTKNENRVYYKHPTHGYDQHDDQPTYPKLRPCTRNIQLMDAWHIQKDKKIHSPVTHMSQTWLCWMNSSVEWCPTSDMISAKNLHQKQKKVNSMTKGFVKVPWICSKWEIIYQWEITHVEFKLYTPFMRAVRTRIQFYCTWKSR
jgi:hypothetical protein